MNNTQFYVAVAIPSILVILAWIQSNSRATDLKESLQRQLAQTKEGTDRQLESTNRQLTDLKEGMDRQFDQVNRRLDRIDGDLKHFHNVT